MTAVTQDYGFETPVSDLSRSYSTLQRVLKEMPFRASMMNEAIRNTIATLEEFKNSEKTKQKPDPIRAPHPQHDINGTSSTQEPHDFNKTSGIPEPNERKT